MSNKNNKTVIRRGNRKMLIIIKVSEMFNGVERAKWVRRPLGFLFLFLFIYLF